MKEKSLSRQMGLSQQCSVRCEQVLAYGGLANPESLLQVARNLKNDGELSAIQLAVALRELPNLERVSVCSKFLRAGGIHFLSSAERAVARIAQFFYRSVVPASIAQTTQFTVGGPRED